MVLCVGGTLVPGAASSALALWFCVGGGFGSPCSPMSKFSPLHVLWPHDFQSWSVVSEKQLSIFLNRWDHSELVLQLHSAQPKGIMFCAEFQGGSGGGFSHQALLQHPGCPAFQLTFHTTGVSVTSHRLEAQSHNTVPSHAQQNQISSQGDHLCF